jgi:hypothetical protein
VRSGKGGAYAFFCGRDCSRAFLTGEFEKDLNDNVTDFTPEQMAGLTHWKDFYLKVPAPPSRLHACRLFADHAVPASLVQNRTHPAEHSGIHNACRECMGVGGSSVRLESC